jgi:transcriptional regulator of acetoin/glycerol metabolism
MGRATAAPRDFPTGLRPAIAQSWQRATLAGVDHRGSFAQLIPGDIDEDSSLLLGAGPVLDSLEESLAGTGWSTILGDRECRVVRRWFDDPRTQDAFDDLNIRSGASMLEECVGTNGLGTVFETRTPVVVNGPEHFVEALRPFSCYGHPIRHPLTHRIEGILDITALVETASPLVTPLIARAVHDIEQRLLGGSRTSERNLLAAFQEASAQTKQAVLAIGEDIVMANQVASGRLSASDVALLRVLAEEPLRREESELRLTLESGLRATVRARRVPGARRGVLLRVETFSAGPHLTPAGIAMGTPSPKPSTTLISGPPGTGRTTRAHELAPLPAKFLRPAAALLEGKATWARDFEAAMRRTEGSVCIDGIDLLHDDLLDLIIERSEQPARPQLILTSGPVSELTGRAAALAGTAIVREELAALSARRADVPALASSMLRTASHDDSLHLTAEVIQTLTAHSWPGNLRELKTVISHVASRRSSGGIALTDLPEHYRHTAPLRPMTALDQAEREVIVTALRNAGGNKVKAAKELGLSRTTLYARIRQLHITGA